MKYFQQTSGNCVLENDISARELIRICYKEVFEDF